MSSEMTQTCADPHQTSNDSNDNHRATFICTSTWLSTCRRRIRTHRDGETTAEENLPCAIGSSNRRRIFVGVRSQSSKKHGATGSCDHNWAAVAHSRIVQTRHGNMGTGCVHARGCRQEQDGIGFWETRMAPHGRCTLRHKRAAQRPSDRATPFWGREPTFPEPAVPKDKYPKVLIQRRSVSRSPNLGRFMGFVAELFSEEQVFHGSHFMQKPFQEAQIFHDFGISEKRPFPQDAQRFRLFLSQSLSQNLQLLTMFYVSNQSRSH